LDQQPQLTDGIDQGFYPRTGPPGREIHPGEAIFQDAGWSKKHKLAIGLLIAVLLVCLAALYAAWDVGSYYADEGYKAAGTATGPSREPSAFSRALISEGQKLNLIEKPPEPVKAAKEEPPPPPPQAEPSQPAEEPAGNYAVQVAVVLSEQLAQPIIDKLKEEGYQAYYYKSDHKNKTYYKIRVGHFETAAQAREVELKLKAQGHKDAFISHLKE
jgi:hypothetical protein